MLSRSEFEAIPEHRWTAFDVTDDYVRSYTYVDINGTMVRAERTQYLADQLLQDANRQEYNDSAGKRWRDGRVVARVPLNKWFADLRNKVKAGDRDHLTWWLNREENRPFRTFKGKV